MVNFPIGFAESSVWCGCLELTVFGQSWGGAARLLTAPENTTHHRAAHRSPSVLRLDTNYQLGEWEREPQWDLFLHSPGGLHSRAAVKHPEDVCSAILKKVFNLLCAAMLKEINIKSSIQNILFLNIWQLQVKRRGQQKLTLWIKSHLTHICQGREV